MHIVKCCEQKSIPNYKHKDDNGKKMRAEIIAGKLYNQKATSPPPNSWAVDKKNEVAVWNIKMQSNAQLNLPKASAGINRTLYFYMGESITVCRQKVPRYDAVEVTPEFDINIQNANHKLRILVLQGKPINENIIQYGPFIMNSK